MNCLKVLCVHIFLLGLTVQVFAQDDIPRDTSYTFKSAFGKVIKLYPEAELVKLDDGSDVQITEDIVYADYDGRKLHLDLFKSKVIGDKRLPLVILIHGGGWASGNKILMHPLAQQIAEEGFIAAAIEYRLSPEAMYPAAVIDIKNAIKFLKSKAEGCGIDTRRVALLGCSAGGHLAAFAGVTQGMKKYSANDIYDGISDRVQAVIDIDGVLDFTDPAESGKDSDVTKPSVGKRWLGSSYKDNLGIWREASPVNYVTKDTPPVLFVNSSIPRFHAGRDEMIAQMNEYGIYSEVCTLEDSPHSFGLFNPWFIPTKNAVINFLNKIFIQQQ